MDDRLSKIDEKLDRVAELQADMGASLREHMRRTELAEEGIKELTKAVQPIQEHVAFIRGLGKVITGLVALLAAIATIWQTILGK